jgi:predicted nucleotidyltransferase
MMNKIESLKILFQAIPDLELAVLVGSQATGLATENSDWDIAIRWQKHIHGLNALQRCEDLKQEIANAILVHKDQIDLIEIPFARLAMRALIAEEGIVLKGEASLAWSHFLTQTWGELEDFYWRQRNAA